MKTNMRKTVNCIFFLQKEIKYDTTIILNKIVISSNCTNINKANNNSLLQYFSTEKTTQIGNACSSLEQAQKCGGIKSINRIPIPSDNLFSNNNTETNKQ